MFVFHIDIDFRLTNEACLVLNKYGQTMNINTAFWYRCFTFMPADNNGNGQANTTKVNGNIIASSTTLVQSDEERLDSNSNSNNANSLWWLWILMAAFILLILLTIFFVLVRKQNANNKRILNSKPDAAVRYEFEYEDTREGDGEEDMETELQIQRWCMETNDTASVYRQSNGAVIEMENVDGSTDAISDDDQTIEIDESI